MQVQTRGRVAPPDPSSSTHLSTRGTAVRSGTTYGGAGGTTYGGGDRRVPPGNGLAAPAGGRPPTKKKRTSPLWARLIIVLGALLMMASGGAIVGSKLLIGRYTGNINQETLIGPGEEKKPADGKALEGPINILLLGVDERLRNPGDIRSDTIIILHIPATHDQAYLVSIPRDTLVDVPAFKPSRYGGGRTKITEAFYAGYQNGAGRPGGAQLVAKVINQLTGIQFNGAAIIDFRGFKRVIDALGGVNMCVDHQVTSAHMRLVDGKPMYIGDAEKHGGGEPVVHKKGCRRMAGWEALDYSRQRYGLPRGDYDRQRHQQQLIKAMAKEATNKGMITEMPKLDRVIQAAGAAFTLDTGGVPIADFVFTLKGMAGNDLVLVKTNNGDFNSAGIKGTSAETLSPESLEMFGAVRDGTLADWLISHPSYVSKEK
jgi:LCP family protein required for cell wall assembly